MPAKAGIHADRDVEFDKPEWTPAFAGVTRGCRFRCLAVMPAKAGIHADRDVELGRPAWTPAFAGVTGGCSSASDASEAKRSGGGARPIRLFWMASSVRSSRGRLFHRVKIQPDVGGGGRLGDPADRDVGDSGLRLGSDRFEGDSAARLGGDPPGDPRHRLAQRRHVHIVEQEVGSPGRQRRLDLVDPVDLDDDSPNPRRRGSAHRFGHPAGDGDVIVLDHRRIPKAHAVVAGAAHPGGVFLERAQAGEGLAGVEKHRAGARDRLDIAPGEGGDAGEVLDDVEGGALGGEQRPGAPAKAKEIGARFDRIAVANERFDLHPGIERAEEGLGDRQAGGDDRLAAVHHPREARVGRDHRLRRDVAGLPQVLGQSLADESVEVETGDYRTSSRFR
jgi:hypothetical protein